MLVLLVLEKIMIKSIYIGIDCTIIFFSVLFKNSLESNMQWQFGLWSLLLKFDRKRQQLKGHFNFPT